MQTGTHESSTARERSGLTPLERTFVHVHCKTLFQSGTSYERAYRLFEIAAAEYEGTKPKPSQAKSAKPMTAAAKGAKRKAKERTAAGIFMTRLAGKRLGNIRYRDLEDIASKSEFEMRFAALLRIHHKPDNLDARLPEIYSAADVAALMDKAKNG